MKEIILVADSNGNILWAYKSNISEDFLSSALKNINNYLTHKASKLMLKSDKNTFYEDILNIDNEKFCIKLFNFKIDKKVFLLAILRDFYSCILKNLFEAYDALSEGIIIVDRDFSIIFANNYFLKLINKSLEDVLGKKCYEVVHLSQKPMKNCPSELCLKTYKDECSDLYISVVKRFFKVHVYPIMINNEIKGFVHIMKEKGEMFGENFEYRTFPEKILDEINEGVLVVDRNYRILKVNRYFSEIYGLEEKDIVGKRCFDVIYGNACFTGSCVVSNVFIWRRPVESIQEYTINRKRYYIKVKAVPFNSNLAVLIYNDITDIMIKNRLFSKIINNVSEGVSVVDRNSKIIFANRLFKEIYGVFDIEEKYCYEVVKCDECPENCPIKIVFNENRASEKIIRKKTANFDVYVKIKALPFNRDHALLIHSNVTENIEKSKRLDRMHKELRDVQRKLEEIELLKTTILTNISHEFKTPITVVNSLVNILMENIQDEEKAEIFVKIKKNILKLLDLVDDLISVARISTGRYALELCPTELKELIGDAVKYRRSFAESRNIEIFESVEPVTVTCDRTLLYRALINLIDNAIKFNKKGGNIYITAKDEGENVRIEIRDTGIGIPKEKIGKIFEPFVQIDPTVRRRYGGTGIGLTLVKKVVEMHNGKIKVESEPGKGTKFTIILKKRIECL